MDGVVNAEACQAGTFGQPEESADVSIPEVFEVTSKLRQFEASEFWTSGDEADYIGCGAFGAVRKTIHEEVGPAVVKCASLNGTKESIEKGIKSFKREAEVLVRLQHPNIVRIFGVTIWCNNVGIVLEYLPCGNLSNFLKCERIPSISWWLRTMFAHQLAAALAFLHHHESHVPFSHGDIKPENILLTRDLVVKLGDFGAANIIRATNIDSTTLVIEQTRQHTTLYAAPEHFSVDEDGSRKPTAAMDMYSYAMVLYEIITRVTVYNGHKCTMMILTVNIMRGTRPRQLELDETLRSVNNDQDRKMFDLLKNIMERCWDGKPTRRPNSSTVRDQLGEDLVQLDVGKIKKEISMLQTIADNRDSTATVQLSEFQTPFIEACCDSMKKTETYDASGADAGGTLSAKKQKLLKNVYEDSTCPNCRHEFTATLRRSWGEQGKESVLLIPCRGDLTRGNLWMVKFVSRSQGRNLPNHVQGVVSKMDALCLYTKVCSWAEAKVALRSHFHSVKPVEQAEADAVIQRELPLCKQFAFSLLNMASPRKQKESEKLEEHVLSLRTWKHPSRYKTNGIVSCGVPRSVEIIALWLRKIYGTENLDFVLGGFEETKWLGDDME